MRLSFSRFWGSRIRALSLLLLFAFVLSPCARAWQAKESCSDLKAEHSKANAALNKLMAQKMPEDKIADVNAVVEQLQDLLKSQAKDQKDVQDQIKKLTSKLPASDAGIVNSVNQFAKSVSGGLSATTDQINAATDALGQVKEKLDLVQQFYSAGDESSAKAQIQAFGKYFDSLASVTGANSFPGLKDLVKAYSQGIDGIAKSAGSIEQIVARDEQIYHDAGFTGDLYVKTKTPRQIRDDMMSQLAAKTRDLESRLANGDCESPAQVDACANTKDQAVLDAKIIQQKMDKSDVATNLKMADVTAGENFQSMLGAKTAADRKHYAESYDKNVVERKDLQQQYDQQMGDLMDLASQNWNAADKALVDQCFPWKAGLMRKSQLAKKKTTTAPVAKNTKPPEAPKCPPKSGGLTGAIEGLNTQIATGCK